MELGNTIKTKTPSVFDDIYRTVELLNDSATSLYNRSIAITTYIMGPYEGIEEKFCDNAELPGITGQIKYSLNSLKQKLDSINTVLDRLNIN